MKSQIQRIRRLCSRDSDYTEALRLLRGRCEASGYKTEDIVSIFDEHENLPRNLYNQPVLNSEDYHQVRLVVLSGTPYEADIRMFAKRMNRVLSSSKIKVGIVMTTGPSISKLLFHNNDSGTRLVDCGNRIVCRNGARNTDGVVSSNVTGKSYQIARNISCKNGGIYVFETECVDQYTGKTTVNFGTRSVEHIHRHKTSSVYNSEREFLWNYRIKGVINNQKSLLG